MPSRANKRRRKRKLVKSRPAPGTRIHRSGGRVQTTRGTFAGGRQVEDADLGTPGISDNPFFPTGGGALRWTRGTGANEVGARRQLRRTTAQTAAQPAAQVATATLPQDLPQENARLMHDYVGTTNPATRQRISQQIRQNRNIMETSDPAGVEQKRTELPVADPATVGAGVSTSPAAKLGAATPQPTTRPATKPATSPATKPAAKPAAKSAAKPAGQEELKPKPVPNVDVAKITTRQAELKNKKELTETDRLEIRANDIKIKQYRRAIKEQEDLEAELASAEVAAGNKAVRKLLDMLGKTTNTSDRIAIREQIDNIQQSQGLPSSLSEPNRPLTDEEERRFLKRAAELASMATKFGVKLTPEELAEERDLQHKLEFGMPADASADTSASASDAPRLKTEAEEGAILDKYRGKNTAARRLRMAVENQERVAQRRYKSAVTKQQAVRNLQVQLSRARDPEAIRSITKQIHKDTDTRGMTKAERLDAGMIKTYDDSDAINHMIADRRTTPRRRKLLIGQRDYLRDRSKEKRARDERDKQRKVTAGIVEEKIAASKEFNKQQTLNYRTKQITTLSKLIADLADRVEQEVSQGGRDEDGNPDPNARTNKWWDFNKEKDVLTEIRDSMVLNLSRKEFMRRLADKGWDAARIKKAIVRWEAVDGGISSGNN